MSTEIPQLDGGGYEKDDDYNAPEEESESSSPSSEFSDDEGSASDSDEPQRTSLRERKSPRTAVIEEESQTKRNTRQYKRQDDKLTRKKTSGRDDQRNKKKESGRGRRNKPSKTQDMKTDTENSTNAMETGDGKFFCANCKKQFATKVSLSNHSYWCAPKRITRSRGTAGLPASRPGPSQQQKKEPKKRGRKPAANKQPPVSDVTDLVLESEEVTHDVQYEDEPESNEYTHIGSQPEEWAESTEESDYETKVNSEPQPIFESESVINAKYTEDTGNLDFDEDEESDVPVSCSNCKMIYRNFASLKKHVSSCVYVSSSASEDENPDDVQENDNTDTNYQFVQEINENIESNDVENSNAASEHLNESLDFSVAQPLPIQLTTTITDQNAASIDPYDQQNLTASSVNLPSNSSYNQFSVQFSNDNVSSESYRRVHERNPDKYQVMESGSSSSHQQLSSSIPNGDGLLKQALSSSINSSNPAALNYQYVLSAQSNMNQAMVMQRTMGLPNLDSNANRASHQYPPEPLNFPSLPTSVRQCVPEMMRNDPTSFSNSVLQERCKSFNIGPGSIRLNSMAPTPSAAPTQHQGFENSDVRHNLHQVASTSGMNQEPELYSHMDKSLHLQNAATIQPAAHQTPDYLLNSKIFNPSVGQGQSNILRYTSENGSQLTQQASQFINKPQQTQPAAPTYQTVTFQGENGQLYRVNIPIPQNAINASLPQNVEESSGLNQNGTRNQYNSTQVNYATNVTPQQSAQEGLTSGPNVDGLHNVRRFTYSTPNSEAAYIHAQHNANHGNPQLTNTVPVSSSIIPERHRLDVTSNVNLPEYLHHQGVQSLQMQQLNAPSPLPHPAFQVANSSQCQGGQNSPQTAHILQHMSKPTLGQVGNPFLSEQVLKQHGEQGIPSNQQHQGYANSINHMNSPLPLHSQQQQSLEHQQVMYQNELARQQHLCLQQQQSEQLQLPLQLQQEQLQKHYQNHQQQQLSGTSNLIKQDVLSAASGFVSQGIGSPQLVSSLIGNPYNNASGLGQTYQTQLGQTYHMHNSNNPSMMPHMPKLQHNQGQTMNAPQHAFTRLPVPQSHFSTPPTLPCSSRPSQSTDEYSLQHRSEQIADPSFQNVKPGTSANLMTQTNSGQQHQMNIPYQIVQGADGTTYIIVQSTQPINMQSSNPNLGTRPPTGILNPSLSQNISEIVQSALISHQVNSNIANNANGQSVPGPSFNMGTSCTANTSLTHPCTCPKCIVSRSSVVGPEKYRKVLPSPRPIEPKVTPTENQIAAQTSSSENPVPFFVKTYMKKHAGKTVKTQLANMIMEKQGTSNVNVQGGDSNIILNQMTEDVSSNSEMGGLRKNPVLTAVVRPMEHPLQKMSDQISQIESIFSTTPPLAPVRSADNSAFMTENTRKDPTGTISQAAENSASQTSQDNYNIEPPVQQTEAASAIPRTQTSGLKRKGEPLPTSPAKSIKVTLKRKERGDSYCINDVSETGASSGPMRSIKIKAKITTGELAGTSTDVVVEPKIHIVPIPDPDADDLDSNLTIAENDSPIVGPILSGPPQESQDSEANGAKLTHRAVVVYEVKCNNKIQFRSSNVRAIWSYVFGAVQWARLSHNLPPISYPATNISLENKQTPTTNFNVGGLIHRAVQFLIQYLPKESSTADKQQFPFPEPTALSNDDSLDVNETGCARTEGFVGRKPFDMFGWLASKHRKPLEKIITSDEPWKNNGLPIAVRFRTMKEKTKNTLTVMWSTIHGRGLYTRRSIEKGEMIIEYAGEVIRSLVCDHREKYYETKSIGCYMFRIDDEYVIDATMKGNAARFINHSCEPNCESKSMKILGKDRIMIFALRKISSGEELTYDYKFEKEDVKIPCACGSAKCRKYLN